MIARPSALVPGGGVAAGLLLVAVGVLFIRQGKSKAKLVLGGVIFVGFGVLLAVLLLVQHGRSYVKGNGEQIIQAVVLFDEPEVTELDPVTHVSIHRVYRRNTGGGPKRVWKTFLWLHRPDGTYDEVNMRGYLNEPVLEHVLTKLAERGVRVEDFRDQAE